MSHRLVTGLVTAGLLVLPTAVLPACDVEPEAPRLVDPTVLASTRFIGSGAVLQDITTGLGTVSRVRAHATAIGVEMSDIAMDGGVFLFRAFNWDDVLSGATIRRVRAVNNGPGFLTFRGDASGTLIEDVYVKANRPNTQDSKIPEGIAFAGKNGSDSGSGITIRRVHIEGIRSTVGRFLNGDGFSVERGYQNISITDSYAGWNSDAGFDIKSPTAVLDRVTSEGNRRNFKFWADQHHGTLTSIGPNQPGSGAAAHIQLQGAAAATRTMVIDRLVATGVDTTPIFEVENGSWDVTIGSCDLKVPPGTLMVSAPNHAFTVTLHLGYGCQTPAPEPPPVPVEPQLP